MKNKTIAGINTDFFPIKKGGYLLDFGFGDGSKSIIFSKSNIHVFAADVDMNNMELFQKYLKNHKNSNIQLVKLTKNKPVPFKNEYFDNIIANEVLEHIPNTQTAVSELYRVLKKNGTICISVPTFITEFVYSKINNNYPKNAGHVHVFRKGEIIHLLEITGFTVKQVQYENFQFAIFWLVQSIFKINPDGNGKIRQKPILESFYWKIWGILHVLRMAKLIIYIGNTIFPKSIYIYAEK